MLSSRGKKNGKGSEVMKKHAGEDIIHLDLSTNACQEDLCTEWMIDQERFVVCCFDKQTERNVHWSDIQMWNVWSAVLRNRQNEMFTGSDIQMWNMWSVVLRNRQKEMFTDLIYRCEICCPLYWQTNREKCSLTWCTGVNMINL